LQDCALSGCRRANPHNSDGLPVHLVDPWKIIIDLISNATAIADHFITCIESEEFGQDGQVRDLAALQCERPNFSEQVYSYMAGIRVRLKGTGTFR